MYSNKPQMLVILFIGKIIQKSLLFFSSYVFALFFGPLSFFLLMEYLAFYYIFFLSFFKASFNMRFKALKQELNRTVYNSTFIEFKYESSSPLNNKLLKEEKIVFILPNWTLEPKSASFLFTPENIDYIHEILAQF